MEPTWNTICQNSIRKEKAETEKRYGIRISQTEIYCAWCGKPATFFHTCQNMSLERKEEIEGIVTDYDRPWTFWSNPDHWREKLGVEVGMSKEEGLNKFREWQGMEKTCQRCQEEQYKYRQYCPINLICKEAEIGKSKSRSIVLGEKSCRSPRSLKIDSLRTTPKRGTVDQPGG